MGESVGSQGPITRLGSAQLLVEETLYAAVLVLKRDAVKGNFMSDPDA